jgi:hypothetical protein
MRLDTIVIDCHDKHALAEFWCALLGTTVRGEVGQYLGLHPSHEGAPRLVFQQHDDLGEWREKGRLHVDLDTHDLEGDVTRAESLGASQVARQEEFGMTWVTMRDPEGNLFCLCAEA